MIDRKKCIFCKIVKKKIVLENRLAYLVYNENPISLYHSLIIPKRHFPDFFQINSDELLYCNELFVRAKHLILDLDKSVTGFNILIRSDNSAKQSMDHCHIHLIPRRDGDCDVNFIIRIKGIINGNRKYL